MLKLDHFLAESLLVCRLLFERVCHLYVVQQQICSHVNSFQDGVEAANDAVFSLIPQLKSPENKQVTIVLGIRINKYLELFQF